MLVVLPLVYEEVMSNIQQKEKKKKGFFRLVSHRAARVVASQTGQRGG